MKRRLPLALSILIAAAQLSWVCAASSHVRERPAAAPLVQLGGLIRASLPALAVQPPETPKLRLSASVLDTERPTVLLQIAGKIQTIGQESADVSAPAEVIRSVNAVLRDFTPEAIEKMPPEQLQGMAELILGQLQGGSNTISKTALSALSTISAVRTEAILSLRGKPLVETLENPGHPETHPDSIIVRGVPENVRPMAQTSGTVFRHYTTKKGLDGILASSALWNGFVSYIQVSPKTFHKYFEDITGAFLTLPGVPGRQVGTPRDGRAAEERYTRYVDIRLPARLPILEIEPGRIYVVPLPDRERAWRVDEYRTWLRRSPAAGIDTGAIREMEAEGGPGPNLEVPVKIVRWGRAR